MKPRRPILATLSLLLCLATLALWLRSYFVCDALTLDFARPSHPGRRFQIALASRSACLDCGALYYAPNIPAGCLHGLFFLTDDPVPGLALHRIPKPDPHLAAANPAANAYWYRRGTWSRLGFACQKVLATPQRSAAGVTFTPNWTGRFATLPLWLLALLTALLPARRLFIRLRRRPSATPPSRPSHDPPS